MQSCIGQGQGRAEHIRMRPSKPDEDHRGSNETKVTEEFLELFKITKECEFIDQQQLLDQQLEISDHCRHQRQHNTIIISEVRWPGRWWWVWARWSY